MSNTDYDYSKTYGIAGQIANTYYRAVSHEWQKFEGTAAEQWRRQIEGQRGRLLAAWAAVKEREHEIGGFIDNKVTLPGLNGRLPALEDLLAHGNNKNSIWNDPLKILFNDGSGFVLSHPHDDNDPAIENLYPPGTFSQTVNSI
jgi:hypothetical protein